jgi:hypothetical protein
MKTVNGPLWPFVSLFLLFGFLCMQGDLPTMHSKKTHLPDVIGDWKLAGPPTHIDSTNIFDYMNGAGELYLAYHFDHLLAYEYRDESGNDILVELYFMKCSDDAFGLLSLDWGGEAVVLERPQGEAGVGSPVPPARALYGTGLLRIWSDDLYARIMAVRETPAAREAILKLGKTIVAGRREPPLPALLSLLPTSLAPHWRLKKERTGYFRSHLVLNSLYYLSHKNILALDTSCEAVFSTYDGARKAEARKRIHLLLIQYPEEERAAEALEGFVKAYLPDRGRETAVRAGKDGKGFFHVEDGWLGFKVSGHRLTLVFGCSDLRSAEGIMDQVELDKS